MLAVQGPAGAARSSPRSPTASCRERFTVAADDRRRRRRRARLRHGLHGRGRRRAADPARRAPAPSGTRSSPAAPSPVGLGARDTLRLEACFHLYGNDLSEDRNPIEAGLGWCCKEATGFIGAEPIARRARAGHGREARPVRDHRPGDRPPGQPGARRRRRHVRHALARRWATASASPTCRRSARRPARRSRSTCAGRRAPPKSAPSHSSRRSAELAEASYPSDLSYHEEHDWARIEGDIATFGITWYAQDQLGEVVFFDPPEVGATVRRGDPYAEVESVKAVSDVIAPLSGEIVEVNEALSSGPEAINEDPYGDGLDGQGAALRRLRGRQSLMDAAAYEASAELSDVALHLRHRRRPPRDARGDRRRVGRRAVRRRAARGPPRTGRSTCRRASPSRRCTRTCATSRRATSPPRTRSRSSAPGCTTTTSRRSSTRSCRARSS